MTSERPAFGDVGTLRLARAWHDVDPDIEHRRTIQAALSEGSTWVADLFDTRLEFGTAGIRGRLGPGPGAINRVLVRVVAAALATFVREQGESYVVVGFDARHCSQLFASDIARVLAAEGIHTHLFDRCTPTPVVAFAVRHLAAGAGVMITASHNPATDNGLKVFGPDGALLAAPADQVLSEHIRATLLVDEQQLARESDVRIHRVGDEVIDAYLDAICLPSLSANELCVAYTPLHGVGYEFIAAAFDRAGFSPPIVVDSQRDPDPDFPTAAFPNPEEPGVISPLLETARSANADLALANDPDADRLAVAVPADGAWKLLSGDDVGCLLADNLLRSDPDTGSPRLVLNTIVSSRLLGLIAADYGALAAQTLTGFKWMMSEASTGPHNDAELVLAYEEALGYSVGEVVRDKDGVSAALAVVSMAADLAAEGKTLVDALDELHRRHGVHVNGQRSLRFESGGPTASEVMTYLRDMPPARFAGRGIHKVVDLAAAEGDMATDAMVFHLDGACLTVRPSGTEPKVKIYAESWTEPTMHAPEVTEQRTQAQQRLTETLDELCWQVADPERRLTYRRLENHSYFNSAATHQQADALFSGHPKTLDVDQALRLVVRSIDLTTLAGDDTPGRVRALCAQARRPSATDPTVGPTAAVCVYPNLVRTAVELTTSTGIAVASVAGAFPGGLSSLEVRLADIDDVVAAGAAEVDVVINRAALLADRESAVLAELKAMRDHIGDCAMKVILETSELRSLAAIAHATKLAIVGGAAWVKTSTGKTSVGATPSGVFTMATVVADHVAAGGHPIGIKISGGVRTPDDALGYLAIVESVLGEEWLDPARIRFGASGLLSSVVNALSDLGGRRLRPSGGSHGTMHAGQ